MTKMRNKMVVLILIGIVGLVWLLANGGTPPPPPAPTTHSGSLLAVCAGKKTYAGAKTYGGWYVCQEDLTKDSVAYLFGVGENGDLDETLATAGVHVYSFDPTPKSVAWATNRGWNIAGSGDPVKESVPLFTPIGIATESGTFTMSLPKNTNHVSGTIEKAAVASNHSPARVVQVSVEPLSKLMQRNGHDWIDVLKLDVEGVEYSVLWSLLDDPSTIPTCQILVEFHDRFIKEHESKASPEERSRMQEERGTHVYSVDAMVAGFKAAGWELWQNTKEEFTFIATKCPLMRKEHPVQRTT